VPQSGGGETSLCRVVAISLSRDHDRKRRMIASAARLAFAVYLSARRRVYGPVFHRRSHFVSPRRLLQG